MEFKHLLLESIPFVAMVMLECLDVGLTTLSKAAMSRGMSHFVFVVYSNALASAILLPSSFFFTRFIVFFPLSLFLLIPNLSSPIAAMLTSSSSSSSSLHCRKNRPPLSLSLLCKFFLLSLAGITVMQNCVFTGINYSSPTLGSAMSNLIPAFTFVLAVIFRMEKLEIRSSKSQMKILGTVVSITGALIVTLYKGASIGKSPSDSPENLSQSMSEQTKNWVIGGLFLATASLSLSVWSISQAAILRGYPSELTIVAFYCLFGTIQCSMLSLIVVRDPNAWTLKPDIELISIIYSAIFGSVVTFSVLTWCIHKKGPVFVAMFKPVSIAIAALMGVAFLGDTLHVGSIIGAVIIAIGFYTVLWAQSKEEDEKSNKVHKQPSSSPQRRPLLESHLDEANILA